LEPDAPEDVVQDSLGFGKYEHAPKPGAIDYKKDVPVKTGAKQT
jgi:hypothetical protein